jgi:hypothetical protein
VTQLPDILRTARPVAPPQLRERVRLITAPEPEPRRVRPWRRGALVLIPVALGAAVAAGVVVGLRDRNAGPQPVTFGSGVAVAGAAHSDQQTTRPTVLPPSTTRLQDYRASLTLQVRDANAVSQATKRAVRLAARLGGVVSRVDVSTSGTSGTAFIVLRVPEVKVTTALAQLGALGRILDQHVSVVDVQRRIDALRRQVRDTSGAARKAAQQQLFAELRTARLSTISAEFRTAPAAVPVPRHTSTAGRILHAEGRIALFAGLVGGPLLALLLAAWLAWRGLRRLSERRLLGV